MNFNCALICNKDKAEAHNTGVTKLKVVGLQNNDLYIEMTHLSFDNLMYYMLLYSLISI